MTESRVILIAQPSLGEEEWLAIREPLLSGWVTQGPQVAAFERAFAHRHQVKYALATTSCTTALHLMLEAHGIGPGDEVIVPAFTWVATANAVVYCGATPVFVDVDRRTFNMDPDQVAGRISGRTKAILPVHLFGLCADLDAIALAAPGIPCFEDCACAAGGAIHGRPAGTLGLAGAFSFHPRKSITTGEGGMLTTNDEALWRRADSLRNHGASIPEEQRHRGPQPYILPAFDHLGYNYRMTDLQAAVGLVQLGKLDLFVAERARWAAYYGEQLAEVTWLRTPHIPAGYSHAWQSYVCYVDEGSAPLSRNAIMERLHARGIHTRPGTHAVHLLGYYRQRFGVRPDDYPNARDCDQYTMAIPLHNRMTAADYAYVVDAIREIR